LAVAAHEDVSWSFPDLATASGLSLSEAHGAVKRCMTSRLLVRSSNDGNLLAIRDNLQEFLLHGVRYSFPAERGRVSRGVPTAHSAPVFEGKVVAAEDDLLVWPHPAGTERGETIVPLYKTVPEIALADPALYDVLALVDAMRIGNAQERKLATGMLRKMLGVKRGR